MSEQQKLDLKSVFKKTKIKNDFTLLNQLIYGFPKTGKTTLASCFKIGNRVPLFLTTEDGHGAIEVHAKRIKADPDQKMSAWEHFVLVVNYLHAIRKEIKEEFSCLILDLVSELDEYCVDFICDQQNIVALNTLDFGTGYKLQAVEFQKRINKLFEILPLIFIAHSTEKEIPWNGEEKVKMQYPDMNKSCMKYINGKVDIISWIIPAKNEEEKPRLTMRPSKTCLAGSRFKHMTRDFELDFNNIQGSFQKISNWFKNPKQ